MPDRFSVFSRSETGAANDASLSDEEIASLAKHNTGAGCLETGRRLIEKSSWEPMETVEISLIGDRDDNQDRGAIAKSGEAILLVVVDGMGGHAQGELAAQTAVDTIVREFEEQSFPMENGSEFLGRCISKAHAAVFDLGESMQAEDRPRATCALCLIQQDSALWAHVGDSRVYHLREGRVLARTRDHSHVEVLLQDGLITEEEILSHPLRNFVECCLGGDSALPEVGMSVPAVLENGDIILACSDGLWGGASDEEIAAFYQPDEGSLAACLEALSYAAIDACAPWSDNTTVAVLRVGPNGDSG